MGATREQITSRENMVQAIAESRVAALDTLALFEFASDGDIDRALAMAERAERARLRKLSRGKLVKMYAALGDL